MGIVALVAGISAGPEQAAVGALVLLAACLVALRDIKSAVFTWQNALIALMLFIWLVPIRLYTLSVSLPFNLEPYRAFLLVLVFAWVVALIARRGRVDAAGHGKALAALAWSRWRRFSRTSECSTPSRASSRCRSCSATSPSSS